MVATCNASIIDLDYKVTALRLENFREYQPSGCFNRGFAQTSDTMIATTPNSAPSFISSQLLSSWIVAGDIH